MAQWSRVHIPMPTPTHRIFNVKSSLLWVIVLMMASSGPRSQRLSAFTEPDIWRLKFLGPLLRIYVRFLTCEIKLFPGGKQLRSSQPILPLKPCLDPTQTSQSPSISPADGVVWRDKWFPGSNLKQGLLSWELFPWAFSQMLVYKTVFIPCGPSPEALIFAFAVFVEWAYVLYLILVFLFHGVLIAAWLAVGFRDSTFWTRLWLSDTNCFFPFISLFPSLYSIYPFWTTHLWSPAYNYLQCVGTNQEADGFFLFPFLFFL